MFLVNTDILFFLVMVWAIIGIRTTTISAYRQIQSLIDWVKNVEFELEFVLFKLKLTKKKHKALPNNSGMIHGSLIVPLASDDYPGECPKDIGDSLE